MKLLIRELREARGWTQEELAERASVARTFVTRLEGGKVGWTNSTLKSLALAFHIPAFELFGYSHPPNEELSELQREVIRLASRLDDDACEVLLATGQRLEAQGRVVDEEVEHPVQARQRTERQEPEVDWSALVTELWKRVGTGQKLAAELGVSPSTVSYWAQGVRRPSKWMREKLLRWARQLRTEERDEGGSR